MMKVDTISIKDINEEKMNAIHEVFYGLEEDEVDQLIDVLGDYYWNANKKDYDRAYRRIKKYADRANVTVAEFYVAIDWSLY